MANRHYVWVYIVLDETTLRLSAKYSLPNSEGKANDDHQSRQDKCREQVPDSYYVGNEHPNNAYKYDGRTDTEVLTTLSCIRHVDRLIFNGII